MVAMVVVWWFWWFWSWLMGYTPHHTKLLLTMFLKMLPNRFKLYANGVDVVPTFY